MKQTVPKRSEIATADTWDVGTIFPSVEAWEEAMAAAPARLERLLRFKGRLGEGPETLVRWLEEVEGVLRQVAQITAYAGLTYSVDVADQEASARQDRARGLYARTMATIAFAEPELLALDEEEVKGWMAADSRLATYDHYFDQLWRRRPHVRSAEVEALLKQVLDAFNTATASHGVLADADLRFEPAQPGGEAAEPVEIAQSNIGALTTAGERTLRRSAWENYADAYLAYKNTMANILATGVKQNVFEAKARDYGSALEAALTPNNIPPSVFHNTVDTFRRHLPLWHRYWRLRRKALGVEQLHVYDIKAPLTKEKPTIEFDQAAAWICEGMEPLGEEYVSAMRQGIFQERWIDKYPNVGKRSGAFSYGVPGTHPFIFMSYTDDIFSVSTLAHELGHSMHSYFSWKYQPFVYARYTLFVAEVASNFNQALVRAHLLETESDPYLRLSVLEEAMSNFHRYFFIMPTLARFELEIHERVQRGEALPASDLIALMADLFHEGYGDEVADFTSDQDRERIGITWAQFPNHLYANFYVYQYTTGIAAAHALAQRVLAEEAGAVEDYLSFLKAGGSLYPLEALARAGVDMRSPEPVEAAFSVLEGYVDEIERLVKRLGIRD